MLVTLYNSVLYKDFNIYFVISFLSVTTYQDNKLANIQMFLLLNGNEMHAIPYIKNKTFHYSLQLC